MNERIVVVRPGGPEKLILVREDEPSPSTGEVKVRILAAGVAFGDVLLRKGANPDAPPYPVTPGYDFVGVVEAIGTGVSRWKIGDRVAGLPITGAYQKYICVPQTDLISVPAELPPEQAVSLMLNYTTAYQLLEAAGPLSAGDRVLIHGAAGGVGTALLELAIPRGIKVYGTAHPSKHGIVRECGGIPIDYRSTDFLKTLRELEPGGVQAAFDPVGGVHICRSYKTLAKDGRLIVFGIAAAAQSGRSADATLRATILAFLWLKLRPDRRSVGIYGIAREKKKAPHRLFGAMSELMKLLSEGKLKPRIARTLPLARAAEAHRMLEEGAVVGKLVLIP